MTNRLYDKIKYVSQLALPAASGFVTAVGNIWGLPYTDEISQTILALAALLGALVGVTNVCYIKKERSRTK